MSGRLKGKTALVTGAARGLGLGIAEAFAAEGSIVVLVDQQAVPGNEAAAMIRQRDQRAIFIQADLAKPDEITRVMHTAHAELGQLDILVNNAAVFLPKPIEQITAVEWDFLMAVNLRAPFLLVQAALPMLKAARGVILNIGSTAALRVFSPNLPYVVAKSGLITMTQSMAQELRQHGIRVNCLCPGAVDTPALHEDVAIRHDEPDVTMSQLQASGYLTTPAQIAASALYLVSDDASAITGSVVVADAGAMLS